MTRCMFTDLLGRGVAVLVGLRDLCSGWAKLMFIAPTATRLAVSGLLAP